MRTAAPSLARAPPQGRGWKQRQAWRQEAGEGCAAAAATTPRDPRAHHTGSPPPTLSPLCALPAAIRGHHAAVCSQEEPATGRRLDCLLRRRLSLDDGGAACALVTPLDTAVNVLRHSGQGGGEGAADARALRRSPCHPGAHSFCLGFAQRTWTR